MMQPYDLPRREFHTRASIEVTVTVHLIAACDFLVAVTATFRLLYVFVVIEHRSRRVIHCNITAHPNAAWTLQQLRETVGLEGRYEYLLHERDSIFATHLDESIASWASRCSSRLREVRLRIRFASKSLARYVASAWTG